MNGVSKNDKDLFNFPKSGGNNTAKSPNTIRIIVLVVVVVQIAIIGIEIPSVIRRVLTGRPVIVGTV